jgi:hypothetical protein
VDHPTEVDAEARFRYVVHVTRIASAPAARKPNNPSPHHRFRCLRCVSASMATCPAAHSGASA